MADCGESCSGGCLDTCTGTCSGTCSGKCSDACTGCTGCTSCSGTCYGTCVADCSETCRLNCGGTCWKSCVGNCNGYCQTICQTYCENKQTYSQNLGNSFSWSNPVETDKTIKITASEWNTLKSYISRASSYCGITAPSGPNASSDSTSEHNIISAAKYNDLANSLNIDNVYSNQTLISASIIDALRNAYNRLQIKNSLPAGAYTGGQGQCCQKGQTCISSGQAACYEVCGNQNASRPGH